jgi:hypothetical protein
MPKKSLTDPRLPKFPYPKMSLEYKSRFVDGGAQGNILVDVPKYLWSAFSDEWSPLRAFFGTIEPGKFVRVSVYVEVYDDEHAIS